MKDRYLPLVVLREMPRTCVVAIVVMAAFLVASGCGGPSAVDLSGTWPEKTSNYRSVYERWTRRAELNRDFVLVVDVSATFKSPEWITANVDRRARLESLPAAERDRLLAEQKQLSEQVYEFELLVATNAREENDFHKGEKSIWRVVLVDQEGNEYPATSIKRDKRLIQSVKAEFPNLEGFAIPYIVTFPRTGKILGDGVSRFAIKMSSIHGAAVMTWRAR